MAASARTAGAKALLLIIFYEHHQLIAGTRISQRSRTEGNQQSKMSRT